jgi:predicted transposase YdaD
VIQAVEHLLCNCEALSSNPSHTRKEGREGGRKEGRKEGRKVSFTQPKKDLKIPEIFHKEPSGV